MKKVKCKDCGEMVSLVFREYYYHIKDYTILGITEGCMDMSVIEKSKTLKDKIDTEIICPKCEASYIYDEMEEMYGDSSILYNNEFKVKGLAKPILIKVEKDGQQDIYEGDQLRASLTIYLPTVDSANISIVPNLRLGKRYSIFNENLHEWWGKYDDHTQTRYKSIPIYGNTWVECEDCANDVIAEVINPLVKILTERDRIWNENSNC